ncbi:PRC-barrel domain-containing protein [Salipiger mangrovisoli]|uniref:PRC-barrel domain-containing protein n=1 Tax=Salipiger mangrovisoli TaxID=2865933 RepID=A0ABR9WWZ1_9RHOB|nr:PRC-barrel domain-containing protein [Salipiger mangrovisoli]MBE9635767.1 PRC-barrel domain-containing protein [Salipiger mangrovisoli]
MKKYLYISVIALPFAAGPLWAQDTTLTPTDEAPAEQMESEAPDSGADMSTDSTAAPAAEAPAEAPSADAPAAAPSADAPTDQTDGTATMDEATDEAAAPVATSDAVVSQQDSAEMLGDWLLSTSVTSPDGETIGSIKDFIITEDGQITAVVLGVGGFLGMGEKDIAVDYSELDIQYDGDAIQLAMTREEADAAPEYQYRDKQTPPPATGDAMGATGTEMNNGTEGTGMGTAAPTE